MLTVTPHLWFEKNVKEAVDFYCSIFPSSRIVDRRRFENTPSGTVTTVVFELAGQRVTALGAGPEFRFNEAFSFLVECDTQEEVDEYWEKLTADGGEEGPCGWCKDRFGLSWQVVPKILDELLQDEDKDRANAVMQAMLEMKKIESEKLREAYEQPVTA